MPRLFRPRLHRLFRLIQRFRLLQAVRPSRGGCSNDPRAGVAECDHRCAGGGVDSGAGCCRRAAGVAAQRTRDSIDSLGIELRGEIGSLRTDMHSEFGNLRTEMHSEIGGLRAEMQAGFREINVTLLDHTERLARLERCRVDTRRRLSFRATSRSAAEAP